MKDQQKLEKLFEKKKGRRDFLSDSIRMFLLGSLFSWPLSSLFGVKIASAEEEKPTLPAGIKKQSGFSTKPVGPPHPKFKQFLGESLFFDITFLRVINAATGKVSFSRDKGGGYVGEIEAKAAGLVGKLTSHRSQTYTSTMQVETVNGVDRLVTGLHTRLTETTSVKIRSRHRFDYKRNKWYYRRYKNGQKKPIKNWTKTVPPHTFYDDFVAIFYNFRAGAYGPVDYGKNFTVTTIPYKGVDKFSFSIATKEEMEKDNDRKWIEGYGDAKYMIKVRIDQKIFGVKAGLAKLLGSKELIPLAGLVKEATSFGNVYATLRTANSKGLPPGIDLGPEK